MRAKKTYKNWKGSNILLAEKIQENLRKKIGHKPTKQDFIRYGEYGAWMALYRQRKKPILDGACPTEHEEAAYLSRIRNQFRDLVYALGPKRAQEIWTDIDAEATEDIEHKIYSQKREDSLKKILYYIIQKMGRGKVQEILSSSQ